MANTNQQPLRELIKQNQWDEVGGRIQTMHIQDVAAALEGLPVELVAKVIQDLADESSTEVFGHLPASEQYPLLNELGDDRSRRILNAMSPDDRTAFLEGLSRPQQDEMLRLLSPGHLRSALIQLGYPDDSAGRRMTTAFTALQGEWTLEVALTHLRSSKDYVENVNTLYVTDRRGRLRGTLSLKKLVLNEPSLRVADLISGEPVSVNVAANQIEAARLIQHYDITALPVVDSSNVMLGVVTVDDIIDVVEEETTEDFHKLGAVGVVALSIRDAHMSLLYRKRIGWLVLLVLVNVFSAAGIAYYEETIANAIVLVFFLPLIVGSGGNAGSQSATLMVRALATGDVQARDWLRLWAKELIVSLALGLTMGLVVSLLGFWRGGHDIALIVSSAMVAVVVTGSMLGMLLPFILTRVKMDPATASAPLITSIADICGILIYLGIASAILNL